MEVELLRRQSRRMEEVAYEQMRGRRRRRPNPISADGQILFHGGCHGCTQQQIHGHTTFCYGCQYHDANWSLPDLNNKNYNRFNEILRNAPPITQQDIDRVSLKHNRQEHFDKDLFKL